MKTKVLTLLCASLLFSGFSSPALAGNMGPGPMGQNRGQNMTQHMAMMKEHLGYLKMAQERGQDLMKMGNEMVRKGQSKKDAKMMLSGAKMLSMGHHMHEKSMHEMMHMSQAMKEHLAHAMMGDMQMSEADMAQLKSDQQELQAQLMAYHKTCQAEMVKMPESAKMLIEMGNQIMMTASKTGDADKAEMGAQMMQMGMSLMDNDEHKMMGKGSRMRVEKEIKIVNP